MVSMLKFQKLHKTSGDVVNDAFNQWKFSINEHCLGDTSRNSYGRIVIYANAWYTTNYQDTEFHLNAWLDSLEFIKEATDVEIEIYNKFASLIDELRGNNG